MDDYTQIEIIKQWLDAHTQDVLNYFANNKMKNASQIELVNAMTDINGILCSYASNGVNKIVRASPTVVSAGLVGLSEDLRRRCENAATEAENAAERVENLLSNGYMYIGVATPSSTHPVFEDKVFYVARQAGTYTNFGGLTVKEGINFLKFNGTNWSVEQFIVIDDDPTAGSNNLVKSRGVYDKLYGLSFVGSDLPNGGLVRYETGAFEQNSPYYCTSDFIPVQEWQVINVTDVVSSSVAVISAYSSTAESSYIQSASVNGDDTYQRIVKYVVPSGVNYIRFSSSGSAYPQFFNKFLASIITDTTGEIPKINKRIDKLSDETEEQFDKEGYALKDVSDIIETNLTEGLIGPDGNISPTGGSYVKTDFIPVNGGEKYDVPSNGNPTTTTTVTFYTQNSQSSIVTEFNIFPVDWANRRKIFTVPFGVSYMRVSFGSTIPESEKVILKLGKISTEVPKIKNIEDYILGKDNSVELFDITNLREGKAIYSSSPYNIIDYTENRVILTDYIDVKGLSWIEYSGLPCNGEAMSVRFSKTKDDNAAAADVQFFTLAYHSGIVEGSIYIGRISEEYRYMTLTVCRVNANVAVSLENISVKGVLSNTYSQQLIKYRGIAPKIPCVAIQMDLGSEALNSQTTYDFVNMCKQYGLAPTFFPLDSDAGNYNLKRWMDEGCEIGIHTVPSDGIGQTNPEPHPNESQFRAIVNNYIWNFVDKGINPIGWVTSQGQMVQSLVPFLVDYVGYAHTLGNGGTGWGTPTDFVNNQQTDRFKIKRWAIEQMNDGSDNVTEADVIADAKTLIDNVISTNGMAILYTHSYNLYEGTTYTLHANVLREILEYIKNWTRQGRLIVGTTAEICNYYFG